MKNICLTILLLLSCNLYFSQNNSTYKLNIANYNSISIFPDTITPKIDFSEIEKLSNNGMPREAIKALKKLEVESLKKKSPSEYSQVLDRYSSIMERGMFEQEEQQKMIWEYSNEVEKLEFPYANILHFYLQNWIQDLYYNDLLTFDDESLLWIINDKPTKLKNNNFTDLYEYHKYQTLKNPSELMKYSSKGFQINKQNNTSNYSHQSLFELFAHTFFMHNNRDENNHSFNDIAVQLLFGKTENLLKIESIFDLNNTAFQLSYYLENNCLANKNYDGYAYWVNKRIQLAHSTIQIEEKDNYRLKAYQAFEEELKDKPASSLFNLLVVDHLISEGNLYNSIDNVKPKLNFISAYTKIENSLTKFPTSLYVAELKSSKEAITSSKIESSIKGNTLVNEAILFNVNYRNMDSMHLKIYHLEKFISYHENHLKDYQLKEIYHRKLTFSKDSLFLPHTKDFILPAMKDAGKYLIIYADSEDKINKVLESQSAYSNSKFGYTILQLSKLNVTTKSTGKTFELLLTDINTGKPIKGASVRFMKRNHDAIDQKIIDKEYKTNKNGLISVELPMVNLDYLVKYGTDSLQQYFWHNGGAERFDQNRPIHSIYLDRGIYRPGQTVHVKVIQLNLNTQTKELKHHHQSLLTIKDQNDKLLWEETIYFNEFGSASTSFVLPKNGFLLGNCTISVNTFEENYCSKNFIIEEYKRPTFEVKFDEIQGKIKLGETVHLSGKVNAFAGYPLVNAKVKINIVQNNYFPRWCFVNYNDAVFQKEIELTTDINGNFKFEYLPVSKENLYGSSFSFNAVVTDITGEVQEGTKSIYVGNRSYSFNYKLNENLISSTQNELTIQVNNSENQEFKGAKFNYSIVKKNADKWYPFAITPAEFTDFNKETFQKQFPLIHYFSSQNEVKYDTISKGTLSSSEVLQLNSYLQKNAGNYELILSMKDDAGELIEEKKSFHWINPVSKKNQHHEDFWVIPSATSAKIGDTVTFIIGSSYKKLPIYIDLNNENHSIIKKWITLKNKTVIKHVVTKEDVNNIAFNCIASKNGIVFTKVFEITVEDDSHKLTVQLQTVRDYLIPGEKEKWNILINNQKGIEKNAELLVGMYDASLDKFTSHNWENNFYYHDNQLNYWEIKFSPYYSNNYSNWNSTAQPFKFWEDDFLNYRYRRIGRSVQYMTKSSRSDNFAVSDIAILEDSIADEKEKKKEVEKEKENKPRINFNETAFFYPTIYSDSTGNYRFEYTLPDALTEWRFMAMAHTKDLKSGYTEHSFKAKKEVMIEPNEPRFFREKDSLVFSSKVINLTDKEQTFIAKMRFFNPLTNEDVTNLFGQLNPQTVKVSANNTSEVNWVIQIPSTKLSLVAYEISAENDHFSDLERKSIPILSNRMLVTTSKTFVKSSIGEETFSLDKINQLSSTAEKISISLEMQTQPLWTTLMSLPYLMEYPYECAEQTFARYFANSTALEIITNHPEFKAIIETWKTTNPSAFLSELEKNPDLKNIILSETPWVLDAQNETAQRQKLSLLFDENILKNNISSSLQKLIELQTPDGGWSWYGGSISNVYITQYIVSGLKHLQDRGVIISGTTNPSNKSIQNALLSAERYLDNYYVNLFRNLKPAEIKNQEGLSPLHIQWLFGKDKLAKENEATIYYSKCLELNWTKFNLQTQAIAGLYALKNGNKDLAISIKKSLLDRATSKPDLGMYWNENRYGYYWNEAPIETQAYLIQFLGNFPELQKEVRQMQIWLLQQKRANSWETTRATTLACLSLFVNSGIKNNQVQQVVKVKFADGTNLGTLKTESSSNFKYTGKDITNGKGVITVETQNESPVFGSIYLQYTDELDKIEKSTGDIRIQRYYYLVSNGKEIEINKNTPVQIGSIIKVKLTITTNNNMEFVHVKDSKGTGFEARETLSNYHYSTIGYYQMNKDASTEFFIDYLPKGNHTLEYEIIVTNKGNIQIGTAIIESMYAPNFRANSGGRKIEVR